MLRRPLATDRHAGPTTSAGRGNLLPALSACLALFALGVLALLLAFPACAVAAESTASAAAPEPVGTAVDVNAPVLSNSQCVACHADLGTSKKPGLSFAHASHLLISCDACHWQPPHEPGNTLGPPMESCFNCHGVSHGGRGEVARSDCAACHTPGFDLRPATHVKDWKGKPHADRALAGANSCLMCHEAAKCDACHKAEGIDTPPTQKAYRPLLPDVPRKPPVKVYPDGPVTMGQCVNCHPDLDNFTPGRVIFAHGVHLQRQYSCESCHPKFAHTPDITARPDMPTCYQCHSLVHATKGTVATGKCIDCHPKDFELKPSDHTKEFEKGAHKKPANKDPSYCAMCHTSKFCTDCHQKLKVVPASHKTRRFMKLHGASYLSQQGACGSCHDSKSCERCHQTTMPHPADWTGRHGSTQGLNTSDCNVCHTDRASCQECHHDPLRGQLLVKENCIGCHAEMDVADPTTIKNKGLAEHAVHFNVAKSKGSPYRCEECHLGFGIGSHKEATDLTTGGHDLRICYQCHGALDYRNMAIAPYPGNSLCLRCHKTLNI